MVHHRLQGRATDSGIWLSVWICLCLAGCSRPAPREARASSDIGGLDAAQAKILGYALSDGNFFTDINCAQLPPYALYETSRPELANDLIANACVDPSQQVYFRRSQDDSPDDGLDLDTNNFVPIDCDSFTGYEGDCPANAFCHPVHVRVDHFVWPGCGDLLQLSPFQWKHFLSGLLPGKGSREGRIVGQSMNKPAGHYTDFDLLRAHLDKIASILQNLQFHPIVENGDGEACDKVEGDLHQTCEVAIPPSEGCRFTPGSNYNLILYHRVPGSVFIGGDPADPRNYGLGPCR